MREPFALLRGIAIHEIVHHRHAVWLTSQSDAPADPGSEGGG